MLDKWHQIDDEIWAKLIVMERNRRVAKAYARAIPIQINGSDDGFDGFRYVSFSFYYKESKREEKRNKNCQVEHQFSAGSVFRQLSIPFSSFLLTAAAAIVFVSL